jgi:hypothetical protein
MKRFKKLQDMSNATKKIEIITTQLRNKSLVLAKNDKRYGICAYSYCNLTQANKMVDKLKQQGVKAFVRCGYPFYIGLES